MGNEAAIRSERAEVHVLRREYNIAIADYDKLIAQQPADAALYIARGRVFRALNDRKSAGDDFTQATTLDSKSPDGYIELGVLAAVQGNTDMAKQSFDKALALGANNARVFAARGRVFADQGKIADSLADLDWALFGHNFYGLYSYQASDLVIRDSEATGNSVRENVVSGNARYGIYVKSPGNTIDGGNQVFGNAVGIYLNVAPPPAVSLEANRVQDNREANIRTGGE